MKLFFFLRLVCVLWYAIGQSTADDPACPVDDDFESTVELLLASDVPGGDLTGAEIDALADGFMIVYNAMQEGECDDETKLIDEAEGVILEERRDLQEALFNFNTTFHYGMFIRFTGRCRNCGGIPSLFNDAIRRLGRKEALTTEVSRGVKSTQFIKQFEKWIVKEHSTGRLKSVVVKAENIEKWRDTKAGNEFKNF
mmetsp:Transcript_12265/g.20320  ORF Transcript_12265/g.20320 Transcript_12265/m.20320 type:complete len:197 (+) Transcript_12265:57-647(+)